MEFIDVDREFVDWKQCVGIDPSQTWHYRHRGDTLRWADLLKKKRVVILAEGGSGKTTEFQQQARCQVAAGKDAWYLTVQDVAHDGIAGSLSGAHREQYERWRASDRIGWLFLDSVDEARLNDIRFEKALRQVASGIEGAEWRTHIAISCRHSDWEFRRDMDRVNQTLPVPREVRPLPPADEELPALWDRAARTADAVESVGIYLMTLLDSDRVGRFVHGMSLPDAAEFLAEVNRAHLWEFASRPLDLGWLTDFWRHHRALGSLEDMVKASLAERLKEPDPQRQRHGALEPARAFKALERLGAAMVFSGRTSLAIPDGELTRGTPDRVFRLEEVLPDYSSAECLELLSRPVFDPATFGRTRLHNDNNGVVRAYLAARWLHGLQNKNLGRRELFDLLFGEAHGVEVVRPSLRETAAWLAGWDRDVAREIGRREPWILVSMGDPGLLSPDLKCWLLRQIAARLIELGDLPKHLPGDALRRFSTRDLCATVRELWVTRPQHATLRWFLLDLIRIGHLEPCLDLVWEVAHSLRNSFRAIEVLMTFGPATYRQLGQFVMSHARELQIDVFWWALGRLFPAELRVADVLDLISKLDLSHRTTWRRFPGTSFVACLETREDIEEFLVGMLDQLDHRAKPGASAHGIEKGPYLSVISLLAGELLWKSSPEDVPALALRAAARCITEHWDLEHWGANFRVRHNTATETETLWYLLTRSHARRRVVFWHVGVWLKDHPLLEGGPLERPSQMDLMGWPHNLMAGDVDWLLSDARQRDDPAERRLAINAALHVWRSLDSPHHMLQQIEAVVAADPTLRQVYEEEIRSYASRSAPISGQETSVFIAQMPFDSVPGLLSHWRNFIAGLRESVQMPQRLESQNTVDTNQRLRDLWQHWREIQLDRGCRAVDDLDALERLLGPDRVTSFRHALARFWRSREPYLSPEPTFEDEDERISGGMALTGLMWESRCVPSWAKSLNPGEARRAAHHAMLEPEGLPRWVNDLVSIWPVEVAEVFGEQAAAEMSAHSLFSCCTTLLNVSRADISIKTLIAPRLFKQLVAERNIPFGALSYAMEVLREGLRGCLRAELLQLCLERFACSRALELAAVYLVGALEVDPAEGGKALDRWLDGCEQMAQLEMAEWLLCLADWQPDSRRPCRAFSLATLERLVRITQAPEFPMREWADLDDIAHRFRGNISSTLRNYLLRKFARTPGRATYDALFRLGQDERPLHRIHMQMQAWKRAAYDSEGTPWHPSDVVAFESRFELLPRTPRDLQKVALRRLEDLQHSLLNGDFTQGTTLLALGPEENAVQRWVADRLELQSGQCYSVERESRVARDRAPDITLWGREGAACVRIEVKVAESCSLGELEWALEEQLCGGYLRKSEGMHGILLLVHQRARPKGWLDAGSGSHVPFDGVVRQLKARAHWIAAQGSECPQPEVAVLDVSGLATWME